MSDSTGEVTVDGVPIDVENQRESHISRILLTADRAYKVLKPVALGFVDFSTRERRAEALRDELELNREFAPDVYLGLGRLGGAGIDEPVLIMQRMPERRRLETLLRGGNKVGRCLAEVAHIMATAHAGHAPRAGDGAAMATRDAVADNWKANLGVLEPLAGTIIDAERFAETKRLASGYLTHGEELFTRRISEGWVRDGHGDLRAEDIFCLADGPRVLDCLGFDQRLRLGDVLLDVGFLTMDLLYLGVPELAEEFLGEYRQLIGETHPVSLAEFYIAYRAGVRAKIAALSLGQGNPAKADEVAGYHDLALDRLRRSQLTMVLVGGGPGTGKSTVASHLSADLELALLLSDEVRKDIVGVGHLTDAASEPWSGIYDRETTVRTYTTMIERADALLRRGEHVVLDASWISAAYREKARAVAAERGARIVEVECRLHPDLAKRRIHERRAAGRDPSDATPDIVDQMAVRAEPWSDAVVLDTSGTIETVAPRAKQIVEPLRIQR